MDFARFEGLTVVAIKFRPTILWYYTKFILFKVETSRSLLQAPQWTLRLNIIPATTN
jgi:hypothetical protein